MFIVLLQGCGYNVSLISSEDNSKNLEENKENEKRTTTVQTKSVIEFPPYKSGKYDIDKCYKKCVTPAYFHVYHEKYPVFNGDFETVADDEIKEVVIRDIPARTEWVKTASKNCSSPNVEDCLTWCLVEKPAEKIVRTIVIDTVKNKSFEIESIELRKQINRGGELDWYEVVCKEEISKEFVYQLQVKLFELNYLETVERELEKIPNEVYKALYKYQLNNDLPYLHFNRITIEQLDLTKYLIKQKSTDSISTKLGSNKISTSHPALNLKSPKRYDCQGRNYIPDQYITQSKTFPIFTGDLEHSEIYLKEIEIKTHPSYSEFIKTINRNCRSDNPKDCIVWEIQVMPPTHESVKIVSDTSKTKNYQLKTFEIKTLVSSAEFTEWRTILCDKKITKSFLTSLSVLLMENGFLDKFDPHIESFDENLKNALINYQKANNLQEGHLDYKTLKHLGLESFFDF